MHLLSAIQFLDSFLFLDQFFQPFSSLGTFQKLLSVWRNLDAQNNWRNPG